MQNTYADLKGRILNVGNGKRNNFCHDCWSGDGPLCNTYADLYDICNDQNLSSYQMVAHKKSLCFRRWLNEVDRRKLRQIHDILAKVALSDSSNKPKWRWEKTGIFSVRSIYKQLHKNLPDHPHKFMWKSRIPLKVKNFMWLTWRNTILTKDNLSQRSWQ